jgi:hypothetical protein
MLSNLTIRLVLALSLWLVANTVANAQVWRAGTPQALPTYSRQGTGVPTGNCTTGQRYFQEDATAGANWWDCTGTNTWTKRQSAQSVIHATFKSPTSTSGLFHAFGFMQAPAASVNLTQASTTQTYGTTNNPYQAHAFVVASAAGTASGGSTGTAKITITGTSFNATTGARTGADSEIIVADVTTASTNKYYESAKTWLGQITYTIATTGDRTTFAFRFNYGFISAEHFVEKSITINQFEVTGRGGNTDAGFNVQLTKTTLAGTGWTYSAAAFVPGGTVLWDMATEFVTERAVASGIRFHFHRKGLTTVINGLADEGVIARITTTQNNAVESCDLRIFYTLN